MDCFTVEQRRLCHDGLLSGFVTIVDLYQVLIDLSAHPALKDHPDAPITKKLRHPSRAFGQDNDRENVVFFLIEEIMANNLCHALVQVALQKNPLNPQLKRLNEELSPEVKDIAEIRDDIEKAYENNPIDPILHKLHMVFEQEAEAAVGSEKTLEKIIASTVEFIDVSKWQELVLLTMFRVCRLELQTSSGRQPIGTGFLVGPDLMLTNYHVIENAHKRQYDHSPESIVAAFDRKLNEDGSENLSGSQFSLLNPEFENDWLVAFGPPDPQDGIEDPIGMAERLETLDYALLRLDGAPGDELVDDHVENEPAAKRGFFTLDSARSTDLLDGEAIFIFGHAQEGPLHISVGSIVGHNQSRVTSTASSSKGSSGSPCFDRDLLLSALHHASILNEELDEGIPIQAIVNDLRSKLEAKGLEYILASQS